MAGAVGRRELLSLYKRLLRSASTYPSKNREGIYTSIRDEFRENACMSSGSPEAQKKIDYAHEGLIQLRRFDGSDAAKYEYTMK
mmetsp:Transcript_46513/g.68757  ORF Transcript_46513/g.68757 Transcript_46513/m.68757 type:complete len:84 (+) Transcript_46513:90-341(+)